MVLEHEGHRTLEAETGDAAMSLLDGDRVELIILDLNLPGADGVEVCRRLRAEGRSTPILMLTARNDVADRVVGLDAGADDYLAKPFALRELLARVRALLRRSDAARSDVHRLADLEVDPASRSASRAGRPIELTKTEFELLQLLVANPGIVLSRDLISERVWGYHDDLGSNTLEVFISNLRRKTESSGEARLIHTARGVGYVARGPPMSLRRRMALAIGTIVAVLVVAGGVFTWSLARRTCTTASTSLLDTEADAIEEISRSVDYSQLTLDGQPLAGAIDRLDQLADPCSAPARG